MVQGGTRGAQSVQIENMLGKEMGTGRTRRVRCDGRSVRRKFLEGVIVSSSTERVKTVRTGKQSQTVGDVET